MLRNCVRDVIYYAGAHFLSYTRVCMGVEYVELELAITWGGVLKDHQIRKHCEIDL